MHRRTLVPTVATLALALPLAAATPGLAAPARGVVQYSAPGAALELTPLGAYETGIFDESAAEIVVHYAAKQRLLVVSAAAATVEVLDVADPDDPTKLFDLETAGVGDIPAGAVANSVAVRPDGLAVVAVEAPVRTDRGWLAFYDVRGDSGRALGAVRVGALPDMVTMTPGGDRAVVANEGEPADDYLVDPEGSVSVVDLPGRVRAATQADVRTARFHRFEDSLPRGVRIYGGREDAGTGIPERPVSENLEPEYVTTSGRFAYVTLQEANAIARVNLNSAKVQKVFPLGTVDRMVVPMDASDRDGAIDLATWPVKAYRLPDALASYRVKGRTYLVTADEGDTRDWGAYSEEARVKDLGDPEEGLAPICDSVAEKAGMTLEELTADENLGRLKVTTAQGLTRDGSCYRTLFAFGGRGISVFTTGGTLVGGTGSELEEITAAAVPDGFNSDHGASAFDDRSDDKGPEPEGITVGTVDGTPYAFVGLERVGGVMVYDLSKPARPRFVTYVNTRDFTVSGEDDLAAAGDLGPEGLAFVKRADSPTGTPVLAMAHEVSGSTRLYDVTTLD
ncbi:choice-of-anchor I family protein [Nocardioides aestuarii]|uniref:Choice-of-anchor I family protein n=1 Tax=Nocardioides aestuarii TaxID=252231 RepID=A0ABW4THU9_9ACTN